MNIRALAIPAIVVISVGLVYFLFFSGSVDEEAITYTVKYGTFEDIVKVEGELQAKNSIEITGPTGLRAARIWQVQISDMVAEGTRVKAGDYIATLDKTEISGKQRDAASELLQTESKYLQTKLDTTLDLKAARENLVNLTYQFKEKKITLEQSQYEPPATIRQAEIDLEKAENALQEAKENYDLKKKQSEAKMQEVLASLDLAKSKLKLLDELIDKFTINASSDGMVTYERMWNGKRKGIGSNISPWDPTVATLPDLNSMISKVQVKEVDIRKVKPDQKVYISLDAYPDKKLSGTITSVANVGEPIKNSNAKGFEVIIEIEQADTTLRPNMTTGNSIQTYIEEEVLTIPLEAVKNQGDSLTYALKMDGSSVVKQEIVIGRKNDNHAIVEEGLKEGDVILLSTPKKEEDLDVISLN